MNIPQSNVFALCAFAVISATAWVSPSFIQKSGKQITLGSEGQGFVKIETKDGEVVFRMESKDGSSFKLKNSVRSSPWNLVRPIGAEMSASTPATMAEF